MTEGPQEHTKVSHTFPAFKKPSAGGGIIDVNKELDTKAASSAEQATADIEKVAQTITDLPDLVSKDPSSKFMTSKDVLAYQKALKLGILRPVKLNKKVIAPGGSHEITVEAMINSIQGCPVCSISTNSLYQMEFVEDILRWHCFRCGLEIDPFNKVESEVLPEDAQTAFGLSAIDDPGEKARSGMDPTKKTKIPLYSNRKKNKETQSSWDKLKEGRKREEELRRLKGPSGRKL